MFYSLIILAALVTPPSLPSSKSDIKFWSDQLGSNNFRERERASKELRSFKYASLNLLLHLQKSSDPEVRRRATSLAKDIRNHILDQFEPYPEIDTLWYDISKLGYDFGCPTYHKCHKYLRAGFVQAAHCNHPDSLYAYRYGTRLWFSDLLDEHKSIVELHLLWLWMHKVDHIAGYGVWQGKVDYINRIMKQELARPNF